MIGKIVAGVAAAAISLGLAAPASAGPVAPASQAVSDFLASARAAGITGTDPAMLEDGYSGAGDCGFGKCRVLRWPQVWCKTIHN